MATIETKQTLLSYGADVVKEYQSIIDLTSFPNAKDRGRYDTALNLSDEKFPAFSTAGGNRNPHYSRAVHFAEKWNKLQNRSRPKKNIPSNTSIQDQKDQQLQAALRGYIERFASNKHAGLNEDDVLKMLKAVSEQRAVSQWSVPSTDGAEGGENGNSISIETAQMMIMSPLTGNGLQKLFSTHPTIEERVAKLNGLKKEEL